MMTDAQEALWISGTVRRGHGRGRALHFPTANLELDPGQSPPPPGIYAAWAELDEIQYSAAVHVGPVPTFNQVTATVEAHLLDFPDRDLYGQRLRIQFVHKLRDIKRFATVQELSEALERDCQQTRALLR